MLMWARLSSGRVEAPWITCRDPMSTLVESESGVLYLDSARLVPESLALPLLERYGQKAELKGFFSNLESLSGGQFSGFFYQKAFGRLLLFRDRTGCKTQYYGIHDSILYVSLVPYLIAKKIDARLSSSAVDHFFNTGYLPRQKSFFEDVHEISRGALFEPYAQKMHENFMFKAAELEALSVNYRNAVDIYRNSVLAAHERLSGSENVVFLSGGIDSVVMLSALIDVAGKDRVRALTYRVKGTLEDETPFAVAAGKRLGVEVEVIEVDTNIPPQEGDLVTHVLASANPYPGRLIYGQVPPDVVGATLFFGQDSRLHTPDVNFIDQVAMRVLISGYDFARTVPVKFNHNSYSELNRFQRGIRRLFQTLSPREYFTNFFLGGKTFVDTPGPKCFREVYNNIVDQKWDTQYVFDMRYLQDIGRLNNCRVALPFYDYENVSVSATLPWEHVTRLRLGTDKFSSFPAIINKTLLRDSFGASLGRQVASRRKAVSNTMCHILNGYAGNEMRADTLWQKNIKERYQPEDEIEAMKIYWSYIIERIYSEIDK